MLFNYAYIHEREEFEVELVVEGVELSSIDPSLNALNGAVEPRIMWPGKMPRKELILILVDSYNAQNFLNNCLEAWLSTKTSAVNPGPSGKCTTVTMQFILSTRQMDNSSQGRLRDRCPRILAFILST